MGGSHPPSRIWPEQNSGELRQGGRDSGDDGEARGSGGGGRRRGCGRRGGSQRGAARWRSDGRRLRKWWREAAVGGDKATGCGAALGGGVGHGRRARRLRRGARGGVGSAATGAMGGGAGGRRRSAGSPARGDAAAATGQAAAADGLAWALDGLRGPRRGGRRKEARWRLGIGRGGGGAEGYTQVLMDGELLLHLDITDTIREC
nr:glycine-rich cell wall structural protein-like [Aegilops tauschii subsp. strangulata]